MSPKYLSEQSLPMKGLWKIAHVALYLDVSVKTIENKVQANKIPYIRLSHNCVRFDRKQIDHWILSKSVMPVEEPATLILLKEKRHENRRQGR